MKTIVKYPCKSTSIYYEDTGSKHIDISEKNALAEVKAKTAKIINFADTDDFKLIVSNEYKALRAVEFQKVPWGDQMGMLYDMFKDSHPDSEFITFQKTIKDSIPNPNKK